MGEETMKFLPIAAVFVLFPFLADAFDAVAHWVIWMLLWGAGEL